MSVRSRKNQIEYHHYKTLHKNQANRCQFCMFEDGEEITEKTEHFTVLKNMFKYDLWDEQEVIDHLLMVPNIHTATLHDFSSDMKAEYLRLLVEYESLGYSNYTRAPNNISKTVTHYHTHLIKLSGSHKSFIFYARKPYLRIAK